jgi:hypothetical protein
MAFRYSINSLKFSDGSIIELGEDDVMVIVGPNNAGKSVALRDIVAHIDATPGAIPPTKVVRAVHIDLAGDEESLRDLISTLEDHPTRVGFAGRMGVALNHAATLQNIGNVEWLRKFLRELCVYLVTTESRLGVTGPVRSRNSLTEPREHPFHYLYDDAAIEKAVSAVFSRAFGEDLIVNRTAGSEVVLHVGARPPSDHDYNVSEPFRAKLRLLPMLHQQGDGMRAFVGCLMWAAVVDYPIVMIDEPEAFLHPPQARLMGRTLIKMKRANRQLLLATHSGDLLRGVLDAEGANVRVLRLVRHGDANVAKELKSDEVRELWADSILRQSNLLDGLFHSQVILSEGDGDSQFYSALAHAIADADQSRSAPDAMFMHCGGKARMPKVVRALRAVGVPVRVIVDFDVLREERPLRDLVEILGGSWGEFLSDWNAIRSGISSRHATQLDARSFRARVESALGRLTGETVPEDVLEELRDHTRKASPWAFAKTDGVHFVPSGEASVALQRLLESAAQIGLHIVPVGQMESFCKTVPGHGPSWVLEVVKRKLGDDAELALARAFVDSIVWPRT